MRYKDQDKMTATCEFIDEYIFKNRKSPSISEIARHFNNSKSTIFRYLSEMDERGMIEFRGKEIETRLSQKTNFACSMTPILGSVSCGEPELTEENFEEYVPLPVSLFGQGDFFILRTHGDSMIDVGIEPGDIVVVKKQNEAQNGDVVVALVNNETTLKTFYYDADTGKITLHPENKDLEDIHPKECYIQGIAKYVIKAI